MSATGMYAQPLAPYPPMMELTAGRRLTGIVCTQALRYFRQYQRDEPATKLMVSVFSECVVL
jgi:hypothetical protein